MKDIITRITEYIGNEVAKRINNNIIDEMINNNYEDVDFKQFMKDLYQEDAELYRKVNDYVKKSELIKKNKKKPIVRTVYTHYDDGGGCGSSRNSSSCGSSSRRSSGGCGSSSSGSSSHC